MPFRDANSGWVSIDRHGNLIVDGKRRDVEWGDAIAAREYEHPGLQRSGGLTVQRDVSRRGAVFPAPSSILPHERG